MNMLSIQIPISEDIGYFFSNKGNGTPFEFDTSNWGSVIYEVWAENNQYNKIYNDLDEKITDLKYDYETAIFIGKRDQIFDIESDAIFKKICDGISLLKKTLYFYKEIKHSFDSLEKVRIKYNLN
jgi:hypothetical protein